MISFINKLSSLYSLKSRIFHYILPVILIFLLNVVYFSVIRGELTASIKANLIDLPLLCVLVFFSHYIVDNFLPGRIAVPFFILFLSLIVLSLVKVMLFDLANVRLLVNFENYHYSRAFTVSLFWYVIICGIISYVKLRNIKSEEKIFNSELEKRRYETEIELLKSQIQPHYFLNTLNSLYYLTLEKSDLAPELVIKFSDLVKYLVYQAKKTKVLLLDEMNVIQNFLDIEKLRYGDRLKINFSLEGEINSKMISPLILLPFIVNCFKNSAEGKLGEIQLDITFIINEAHIMFNVDNVLKSKSANDQVELKSLNGLSSTKKRLDLLYKNKYDLSIFNTPNKYSVQLKLPLYHDKVFDN